MRPLILSSFMACVLAAAPCAGQSRPGRLNFLAVRTGANLVGNAYRVGDVKPTGGVGVSGGRFLSRFWAAEFEAWYRPSNPECCGTRERVFSLTAERLYAAGGIQPYLAGGVALLQSRRPEAMSGAPPSKLQIQITAGLRVPLAERLAVDLDARANGGGTTMIVRPTIAAVYFF